MVAWYDEAEGTCAECGEPCRRRDMYLVRVAVWALANLPRWGGHFLHAACLEKRIGRPLVDADYLVKSGPVPADGSGVPLVVLDQSAYFREWHAALDRRLDKAAEHKQRKARRKARKRRG